MKSKYKEVEYLLYNYDVFKVSIENIKKEIEYLEGDEAREIEGVSYEEERSKTNSISNIVENTMLGIAEKIHYLERKIERTNINIEKIDNAMTILTDIEKDIIKKKYFKGKQWYVVAYEVSYSERQCRYIKNRAIDKIILAINGSIAD